MIDPSMLFKVKSMMDRFNANHPRFVPFIQAVNKDALKEDTVVDIKFTTKEGDTFHTNLKLNQDDLDMFRQLFKMA